MAWFVIGYDDPTLLKTLHKMGVLADRVTIRTPRPVTGITFPEENLADFFMATGQDSDKIRVERFPTDQENVQFILLRGQTTVDCEIPQYLPVLERVARRFGRPITYMTEGQTGRDIEPGGIMIIETNGRQAESKTCQISGRAVVLRFSKPNPLSVPFADNHGFVFAEVSPNTVRLLVRISDILDTPGSMKLFEDVLYRTVSEAIDPGIEDCVNQLKAEEKKRQEEQQRIAEARRREEEEKQRREEEVRRAREAEVARIEQAERREKLLKVGALRREQYIKASMSRRQDDTRGLDELIEKNQAEFEKNQAKLVKIGWKREVLKYRMQSIREELERTTADSSEIYNELAAHPRVAFLLPDQDSPDFVVVTKPLPENSENGRVWCISLSGQAPRVWEKNGTVFGSKKKELDLYNHPDIFAPAINFFASGNYASVVMLLINWLEEDPDGNTRGEGTGAH